MREALLFSVYLPMFAGGAVLGASVMWCICKAMARRKFARRTRYYRG